MQASQTNELQKENKITEHISFSELKNWCTCPHYHKLIHKDKLAAFEGNIHTAFGTAMHSVCESVISNEKISPRQLFEKLFTEEIEKLPSKAEPPEKMVKEMRTQGFQLSPLPIPALSEHFGEFTYVSVEEKLYEPIEEFDAADFKFKGFIDLVIKTPDNKYHIIDWKTCSWGWDSRRKNEKMTTYQLTLYKKFWAQKMGVPLDQIETHFALLKRTAKTNKVEIFRVTSGPQKIKNAVNLMLKALYNIHKNIHIKNKLSCHTRFGPCEFYKTEHCP